jgi:hypothetical protein
MNFLDRLHEEQLDLKNKVYKLRNYINTEPYNELDETQKSLLIIQLSAMETYSKCLSERYGHIKDKHLKSVLGVLIKDQRCNETRLLDMISNAFETDIRYDIAREWLGYMVENGWVVKNGEHYIKNI